MSRPLPTPYTPLEPFDWATNGRALSLEEVRHLRRLLVKDGRYEHVRQPELRRRKDYEVE